MLFEDGLPVEKARALRALEEAADLGIPWPFDDKQDSAMLDRIKRSHPKRDIGEDVDQFLMWCMDNRPWEKPTGRTGVTSFRLRLWNWMRNSERYGSVGANKRVSGKTWTHHYAEEKGHAPALTVSDRW